MSADNQTMGGCLDCAGMAFMDACPKDQRITISMSEPRPWCWVRGSEIAEMRSENADLRARIAELESVIDSLRSAVTRINHQANVATLRQLDAEAVVARLCALHPETGEVKP